MLTPDKRQLLTTVHTNKQTTKLPRKAAKVNAELLSSVEKRDLVKGMKA
jgi:hypothetical protein